LNINFGYYGNKKEFSYVDIDNVDDVSHGFIKLSTAYVKIPENVNSNVLFCPKVPESLTIGKIFEQFRLFSDAVLPEIKIFGNRNSPGFNMVKIIFDPIKEKQTAALARLLRRKICYTINNRKDEMVFNFEKIRRKSPNLSKNRK